MHDCREERWQDCIRTGPGSGQGRVNFCSSQGEHVQDPVVILYHLMGRKRGFLQGEGVLCSRVSREQLGNTMSITRELFCLSCTLCYWYCSCYCLLSFLTPVSSKLFLSQPGSLLFVPSILLSRHWQEEGEAREQGVSAVALSWGVSVLNHRRPLTSS